MELPTGYVADRIGYRRALTIGASFWVVGWALYLIAQDFAGAAAAEIALGAGMAFVSGSDSALLWVSLPDGAFERPDQATLCTRSTCA